MNLPRFAQSPLDPDFIQDPYPFYDQARAAGPLFYWEDYSLACAAGYEQVDALLRDRRFGREAPACIARAVPPHLQPFYDIEAHSMLELEPPRHTRLRGQVLRAFTARQVAEMGDGISQLCADLIAAFPTGPFDLLSAYAERIPVTVIARMMGVPEEMGRQLLDWSHAMVAMYQARRDRTVEDAAVTAAQEFRAYIETVILEKRASPTDDLISRLATAEDGALSDAEIVSTCILLLNAGHEATVHAIGNGFLSFATADADRAAAYSDAEATRRATNEVLRHDPPLHMFTRFALEPVTIAGHTFAEGDEVALLLGAANRDPALWQDPHQFDPFRQVAPHVALGAGIHFCVGAPLARLELDIAMPALFSACPFLRLAEPPRFADRYHFHGLETLMVQA